MRFDEMGRKDGKTLMLLPGTACTWEINFHTVIDRLAQQYHLICVNYDGFDDERAEKPFTDMLTVTKKIEDYVLEKHGGHVDGAYGSSLGGSFVGLLIQRKRIHIGHGFIGSSDLDQGSPAVARIMTWIVGRWITDAAKSEKKRQKLKAMLVKNFGMDMDPETDKFMDQFAGSMVSLHPQTVCREFYSDYVTPLEDDQDLHRIHPFPLRVKCSPVKLYAGRLRCPVRADAQSAGRPTGPLFSHKRVSFIKQ